MVDLTFDDQLCMSLEAENIPMVVEIVVELVVE